MENRLASYLQSHFGIQSYRVFSRELGHAFPNAEGPSCRLLDHSEIRALASVAEFGLNDTFIEQAGARGDICIGAFDDERPVACAWIAFSQALCGDIWVGLDERACSLYRLKALEQWQERPVRQALMLAADGLCQLAGRDRALSFVPASEIELQADLEAIGARCVAEAHYSPQTGMRWASGAAGAAPQIEFFCVLPRPDEARQQAGCRP